MAIPDHNHIIMTPGGIGGELGALPSIVQGASGSMTIYAYTADGSPFTLSPETHGYYWRDEDEIIPIDGQLTTSGNELTWAMTEADTAVSGDASLIVVSGGYKSLPTRITILEDVGFQAQHEHPQLFAIYHESKISLGGELTFPTYRNMGGGAVEFLNIEAFQIAMSSLVSSRYPSAMTVVINSADGIATVWGISSDLSSLPPEILDESP